MNRMIDVRKMTAAELPQALEEYRTIIRTQGVAVSVYERARCEEILNEINLRDKAVVRAFPCSACKGAGSCSVCHTL